MYGNVSLAESLSSLPEPERDRLIRNLSRKEAEALLYDWTFWARPKQLPPPGDWFVWLIRSGRGFGKTRTGSEWIIARAASNQFKRIALVGQTKGDVRDTMIEVGESAILQVSPPWFTPEYEPSKRRLTWPNGCVAMIYSGDEPDQLRGPQHDSAWIDEFAKFKYPEETWSNLTLGLRIGPRPQALITSTPRPLKILREILARPSTIDVRGSSYENIGNLSPVYILEVLDPMAGTRLGRQELEGEIISEVPGALWRRDDIERARMRLSDSWPDFDRVTVNVDPAASSGTGSNETGITVTARARLGKLDHGYLLDDLSGRYSPDGWARRAVDAYRAHQADRIVAERNQGGEMVEHTIRTVDRSVPVKLVHASRGKHTRAEPVAALYEQGRCHHIGCFAELEDQLCTWLPGEPSPDRMDSLVWGFTELLLGGSGGGGVY